MDIIRSTRSNNPIIRSAKYPAEVNKQCLFTNDQMKLIRNHFSQSVLLKIDCIR